MDEQIKVLAEKIRSIEIQGATNTAVGIINGLAEYADRCEGDLDEIKMNIEQTAQYLVSVRPTEPLAKNAVKYVLSEAQEAISINDFRESIQNRTDQFVDNLTKAKQNLIDHGLDTLKTSNIVLTHCHSSAAEAILKKLDNHIGDLIVIATETRPLYQGRITSTHLLEAGVDVVMIVDNAAAMFLADDSYLPVDSVIIGCDEFTSDGTAINKVGSFSIALAAKFAKKPLYVATPLLKAGTETVLSKPVIEQRPYQEIWPEAPEKLKVINPAFEIVPPNLITGYISEEGLLSPSEVFEKTIELYPWLK